MQLGVRSVSFLTPIFVLYILSMALVDSCLILSVAIDSMRAAQEVMSNALLWITRMGVQEWDEFYQSCCKRVLVHAGALPPPPKKQEPSPRYKSRMPFFLKRCL